MNNKLKNTIEKLAPAVFTSLIATTLGLLSLFKSDVPMIQDFGMMLAIGIGVAFVLAILMLIPILVVRDKVLPKEDIKKQANKSSKYIKVMQFIAHYTYKFKYVILIIAVISAGLGFLFDQEVDVETDFETFMPQDSLALSDIHDLRDLVGSTKRVVLLYQSDHIESFDTLNNVEKLTEMVKTEFPDKIETLASVSLLLDQVSNGRWSENNYLVYLNQLPADQLRLLHDTSTQQGIINIALSEMTDEEFEEFILKLNTSIQDLSLNIEFKITGQSIVDQEMLESMTSDRLAMALLGVGLVFIALLAIYRNFYKALIAVLPIIFIIGWSGWFMYLLGYDYTPLTSTLGALIIGIGTEFTILILMRFYDYKGAGFSQQESIEKSVANMGKPIIVSAVTTIGGFSALIFSDFEILSNFGIMTVVNLSLALISALLVLPALLGVIGKQTKVLSHQ